MWWLCIVIALQIGNAYLVPSQWRLIEQTLQTPNLSLPLRREVDNILFQHHLPLAYRMFHDFVSMHQYKSRMVPHKDLKMASVMGLYHAIRKYDGKSNFNKFACIYISGSLYNTLTKQYPISKDTPKHRRSRRYVKHVPYDEIGSTQNWYLHNRDIENNAPNTHTNIDYALMWSRIDTCTPFQRRLLRQKFDYQFDVIQTNRIIAHQNSCSEELVRRNIYAAIQHLTAMSVPVHH
jgi:RNA polymerase sigma factor (sigma-70 family)